ncbi:MAG: energy transducer TonB [Bacteroidota bacterium]
MKKLILTSALFLFIGVTAFTQHLRYEYPGKLTSSVTTQSSDNRRFISEVTPLLWQKLVLPYRERVELEERRKKQGYYLYPEQDNYQTVIQYVSVEISAICNGINRIAQSTNDKLSPEQKNILKTADLGTDISIKIKFKYKYPANNTAESSRIIEGDLLVTVVPDTGAEYPGGVEELTSYLKQHLIDKMPEASASDKLRQVLVKFTVNENGEIVDAKLARPSTNAKTDQLLLDVIHKMPKWKPAQNTKGSKIKQHFSISFETGC